YPNLFDASPPFQIDGNFGVSAAIAEMLVQSQNERIELLPALPASWKEGTVSGLRARGGFEVDLSWKDGKLISATIHSVGGEQCQIAYGEITTHVKLRKGKSVKLRLDGGKLRF
ncbi:MAG TPA: glycoside hydrolase family 95 protein, partial [Verrucomicrobiae bacterium]